MKQLMTNKEMEIRAKLVASLERQHVVLTTDHWTSVARQNYTARFDFSPHQLQMGIGIT